MYSEVEQLIRKRDNFLRLANDLEKKQAINYQALEDYKSYLEQNIRIPTLGYVRQKFPTKGFHAGDMIENFFSSKFEAVLPIKKIIIKVYLPFDLQQESIAKLSVNGKCVELPVKNMGQYQASVYTKIARGDELKIQIISHHALSGKERNINEDKRKIAFVLSYIEFVGDA